MFPCCILRLPGFLMLLWVILVTNTFHNPLSLIGVTPLGFDTVLPDGYTHHLSTFCPVVPGPDGRPGPCRAPCTTWVGLSGFLEAALILPGCQVGHHTLSTCCGPKLLQARILHLSLYKPSLMPSTEEGLHVGVCEWLPKTGGAWG